MFTREDIKNYYDEYKKNLTEEENLSESVFDVETSSELEMKLIKRKHDLSTLYRSNQQLLKQYVYPLINKEEKVTKEIADEIIEQAYNFIGSGFIDEYGGLVMLKIAEDYYSEHNDIDRMIKLYLLLGISYKYKDDERIKSIDYYKKQTEYIDYFFETLEWETQRLLLTSLYNYPAQALAVDGDYIFLEEKQLREKIESIVNMVEHALDFYNREDVRTIAGERFDFDSMIEELIANTYGKLFIVCAFVHRISIDVWMPAIKLIEQLYEKKIADNDDIYKLDLSLCCAYFISQYMQNKYTQSEFVERYYEYCKHILDNSDIEDHSVDLDSQYMYICNHCYMVLYRLMRFENVSDETKEKIVSYHVDKYLHMMEAGPKYKSASVVNTLLFNSVRDIVNILPAYISKFQFIMKIMIKNDENLMISSIIVRNLTSLILDCIYEQAPELLIGLLDTTSVAQVFEKQEDIRSYVRNASIIYDIGKIGVADIIKKQTRMLNEEEAARIQLHSEFLLGRSGNTIIDKDFVDVIKGHHKYYDGSKGYPVDFDNTKSKYKFVIDLISICDELNASTDYYNRIYKNPISFEQFLQELCEGAGTRYNPDIVKLIVHNKQLQSDLKECCITKRINFYYEAYFEFVNKSISNDQQGNGMSLPAWTKNALRVLEIDFLNDIIKTKFINHLSYNSVIEDTAFSTFPYYLYLHMVHPEDEIKIKRIFDYGYLSEKISENNGTYEIEIRVRKNENEEYRWLKFQFLTLTECFGIAQVIDVIITDVDEQHKRKRKMQEALEKSKNDDAIAERSKKLFISNVSHQIRTPMNTIVGMARMLSHAELSNENQQYMKNLVKSSNELIHIVYDMMDFTNIVSDNIELVQSEYSLFDILNEISLSALNEIGEKPIELIYNIDQRIPKTLCGDASRIKQIIATFVRNAIKFTNSGSILLGIKIKNIVLDEIEFIINIKDTGNGIQEEALSHIFESVNTLGDNNSVVKTGLELFIAKKLIEMLDGSVTVKSTLGRGTEFFITVSQKIGKNSEYCDFETNILPQNFSVGYLFSDRMMNGTVEELCKFYKINFVNLSVEDREVNFVFTDIENLLEVNGRFGKSARVCVLYNPLIEKKSINTVCYTRKPLYADNFVRVISDYAQGIVKSAMDDSFTAPRAKILVVDDTTVHLTVAKGLLQPLLMSVDTADSGIEAIEKIKNNHYNIIFMDYKMPVMDGVETVRKIRAMDDEYYKKVPIIALTANDGVEARNVFSEVGIYDVISKPISINELVKKVRKWLPSDLIEEYTNGD